MMTLPQEYHAAFYAGHAGIRGHDRLEELWREVFGNAPPRS